MEVNKAFFTVYSMISNINRRKVLYLFTKIHKIEGKKEKTKTSFFPSSQIFTIILIKYVKIVYLVYNIMHIFFRTNQGIQE